MQENKRNKETSLFKKPQGFRTVRIHFTAEAIEWLGGTTKDDDGNTIGNHTLFYDLLSRMRLSPGTGRFIPQAAGIAARTVPVLGNQTRGGMEHREKKNPQSPCNDGKAGHDSGGRFQNRFRRFHDLCRGMDGLSELPRRKPLQSRPEWYSNGI